MSNYLQGKQFHQDAMFMTPDEISQLHSGDFGLPMHEAYSVVTSKDKEREQYIGRSHLGDLRDKIEKDGGIKQPITVQHGEYGRDRSYKSVLINGHHRSTIAARTGRLVPVNHVRPGDKIW